MATLLMVILALAVGLAVGMVLQRGRGCTNSTFRNLILARNGELANFLLIAVCIEVLGYAILAVSNLGFSYTPLFFSWLLVPIGGFIFGIGTVFAGGCAGSTCYRVGEGSGNSLIALFGYAVGIGIFELPMLNTWLGTTQASTAWQINGLTPSLVQLLPMPIIQSLAVLLLVGSIIHYRRSMHKLTHLYKGWSPIRTGILLGLLGIAARLSSMQWGRQFGLSTVDGIGQLALLILALQPLSFAGLFITGLIIGSFVFAWLGHEFSLHLPEKGQLLTRGTGGIMLGIGAMLAGGCNFGHILGGIPELGLSSFAALLFMMLGNWTGSYLYYVLRSHPLPQSTPVIQP